MPKYGGFIYFIDEPKRAEEIADALRDYKTEFTDVVSSLDFQPKRLEIFLISFDGKAVEMASLVRKVKRVAYKKDCVRFTNIVIFEPLPLDRIETLLKENLKPHFSRATSGVTRRLAPKTWQNVWAALKQERNAEAAQFEELERLRLQKPTIITGEGAKTLAYEKDAAILALRLAGLDGSEFIHRLHPQDGLSLFNGISAAGLGEDQMVKHDASIFHDWDLVQKTRVGESIFKRGSRVVTIIDVNRTSIEKTLGVDLLYYFRPRASFVMVQYKRMVEEGDRNDLGYRPDKQCLEEAHRMSKFLSEHPGVWDQSPENYRLNHMPFYFKLCPKRTFGPTSDDMLKGIYLPLDLWKATCDSPAAKGPKGGIRLTYKNTPSRLNTTAFISLVQTGLFGSSGASTNDLMQLVREKVDMDHSVVLAEVDDEAPASTEEDGDDDGQTGNDESISW